MNTLKEGSYYSMPVINGNSSTANKIVHCNVSLRRGSQTSWIIVMPMTKPPVFSWMSLPARFQSSVTAERPEETLFTDAHAAASWEQHRSVCTTSTPSANSGWTRRRRRCGRTIHA